MGCGASHAVHPDSQELPDYCIRGAALSADQSRLLASSWEACMEGTQAWRATLSTSPSESATGGGKTEPGATVAAAGFSSMHEMQEIAESPIVHFYDTFYAKLFELCPPARALFPSGLHGQGRKLVKMIKMVVVLLGDVPKLVSELQALAERHVAYKAQIEHYGPVGHSLLFALERCCGPEVWTPEVAHAWLTAYSVIVSVMIPAQMKAQRAAARRP